MNGGTVADWGGAVRAASFIPEIALPMPKLEGAKQSPPTRVTRGEESVDSVTAGVGSYKTPFLWGCKISPSSSNITN